MNGFGHGDDKEEEENVNGFGHGDDDGEKENMNGFGHGDDEEEEKESDRKPLFSRLRSRAFLCLETHANQANFRRPNLGAVES